MQYKPNKINKPFCEGCGVIMEGRKRKYCTPKCRQDTMHEINRVGFGYTGTCHSEAGSVHEAGIESVSIPHHILEQAKFYDDCTNPMGHVVVEDPEDINKAMMILHRATMPKKKPRLNTKCVWCNTTLTNSWKGRSKKYCDKTCQVHYITQQNKKEREFNKRLKRY
tara:strand:- start:2760 stop:3257 length:498 start_codon:yes stop_codon:yes gene_type:complete